MLMLYNALKDFLEQKIKSRKGPIIDQHGKKIEEHEGLYSYTIGQRQGIKVGATGPYYVTKKDLKTNTLYVTNDPKDKNLQVKEVEIHSMNWIGGASQKSKVKSQNLVGRYRHQGELVPLSIKKIKNNHYLITFKKPQKALASGQSLVLYKGTQCLGGGVIV